MGEDLRAELLARCEEDQRVRTAMQTKAGQHRRTPGDIAEITRIDKANTAWLTELTARIGWPGQTMAGKDGAHAAWLLAQHAPPEQQPAFLQLLRAAVQAGDAPVTDLAYLQDRVRLHAGQPQLYGTQFIRDDQGLRPHPIEDQQHLDQRRAWAGMGPFGEYQDLARRHD